MPTKSKKKVVKTSKPKVVQQKKSFKHAAREHFHFLGILVLLVGFSSYAIVSFVSSNNNYLDHLSANVTASDELVVKEDPNSYLSLKENPFGDLTATHPNIEEIITLYYEGILNGYPDGTFQPDNKVNRAEFAKMLVEAARLDYTEFEAAQLANCFGDVKDLPDHWFAPSVCVSKQAGWVKGYEGEVYGPGKNINRAEALKIILSAFEFDIPENEDIDEMPYSDVALEGQWYLSVAEAAKEEGLISAEGAFEASREVTRGEIAQMLFNAMKAKDLL